MFFTIDFLSWHPRRPEMRTAASLELPSSRYFPYTRPGSVILPTPAARFNGTPLVSLQIPSVWRFRPADLAANSSRTRLSWRFRAAPTVLRVESTALRCVAPLNSVEPTAGECRTSGCGPLPLRAARAAPSLRPSEMPLQVPWKWEEAGRNDRSCSTDPILASIRFYDRRRECHHGLHLAVIALQ